MKSALIKLWFPALILFFLPIPSHSATNYFFIDWGPDKALHAIAGTVIGFNYCLLPFEHAEDAYLTAVLVDAGITLGKEIFDSFTGGTVELADIAAGLLPALSVTSCLFALERYSGIRLRIGCGPKEAKLTAFLEF